MGSVSDGCQEGGITRMVSGANPEILDNMLFGTDMEEHRMHNGIGSKIKCTEGSDH